MTAGNAAIVPISKDVLWEEYYTNLHSAYNSLQDTFAQSGLTQDDLSALLDCSKSNISKRLNGRENLTLKTLSFMGTAMQCRLTVSFVPYSSVGMTNYFVPTPVHSSANAATVSTVSVDIGKSTITMDSTTVNVTGSSEPAKSGNASRVLEPA